MNAPRFDELSNADLIEQYNEIAHTIVHFFKISEDMNEPPSDAVYKLLSEYKLFLREIRKRFPSKANGSVKDD